MLGTRTLCKGGVMIRWLGHLGRCVGASYHASFCCGCVVCSGCVLGTFDYVQLQVPLHLHDVVVVTFCKILFGVSCMSLVPASIQWGATPHIIHPPPVVQRHESSKVFSVIYTFLVPFLLRFFPCSQFLLKFLYNNSPSAIKNISFPSKNYQLKHCFCLIIVYTDFLDLILIHW